MSREDMFPIQRAGNNHPAVSHRLPPCFHRNPVRCSQNQTSCQVEGHAVLFVQVPTFAASDIPPQPDRESHHDGPPSLPVTRPTATHPWATCGRTARPEAEPPIRSRRIRIRKRARRQMQMAAGGNWNQPTAPVSMYVTTCLLCRSRDNSLQRLRDTQPAVAPSRPRRSAQGRPTMAGTGGMSARGDRGDGSLLLVPYRG